MKFHEAMKLLEEGRKIRCKDWAKKDSWHKDLLTEPDQPWNDCTYRIYRMMQEEWELYEDPKIDAKQTLKEKVKELNEALERVVEELTS